MTIAKLLAATILGATLTVSAAQAAETVTTHTQTVHQAQTTTYATPAYLSNVYVGGQVGWNHPTEDDLDDTASFTGVIGYKLAPQVRTDLEISYRNNDGSETVGAVTASGDVSTWGFMLNAWYDFTNNSYFTPYIGGGIGLAHSSLDIDALGASVVDDSDTAFAWQLGAGVAYDLGNGLATTVDYRYLDTSDFDFDTAVAGVGFSDDYTAHEVRVGLRYNF